MKKLFVFLTITYLVFTINSNALEQNSNANGKILKIGVILPLSGKFEIIGQSFLKAIQLALEDIGNESIIIYPKDNKANALETYNAAKELNEEHGIKIVIGPIFHDNLERLNEISNITFISLTNKTQALPRNIISFGININSQLKTLDAYLNKIQVSKTVLLSPKTEFISQTKTIEKSNLKFNKIFLYDTNPNKITNEIEILTNYRERKRDLERRIKILEKSELYKDEKELEKLKQKHTLGKINFDSVVIVDFGERLKSVITSFIFSDISSNELNFFTLNQWFDETLFDESALENLHFPSINYDNFKKFEKKYYNAFDEKPSKLSILAYDALGLIYYCWESNNHEFKTEQLFNKNGFKGMHGEFFIKNNISNQLLNMYKISNKKFKRVN
tara:strand:- start:144 stop:1310 length:1167 start_codon:yes stop_codon:yes gene_type:complete